MVGAVIYVRVSTKEQTENLSLPTQLRACEEYCRRQGYEVLERFHEEGESAKSTDRSQLQNLLTFCRLNKGRVHFVVVFNLTRFARDKYDHFALRSHLQSLGISLRSATEPIDDTATGKLMEGVLAAFAQLSSDLDKATKAQLDRGQRMVELLKQPQYQPMPTEDQVAVIWAATNGFLDTVAVADISRYQTGFLQFLKSKYSATVEALRAKKELSEDVVTGLKQAAPALTCSRVSASTLLTLMFLFCSIGNSQDGEGLSG